MSSSLFVLLFTGATAAFALWAAVFATRADRATRRAIRESNSRWEASTRPVPHITFTEFTAPGQSIQVQVENLGGTLAGCGIILQHADEIYATELTLPEKSPARPISLPFIVKAWKRVSQPQPLLLIARDVSGRCFDCLDGGKQVKDPKRWVANRLRELRMQGMVTFPSVTGPVRS
ncbi:MAG TPA: hypothetical protein VKE27_13850 [Candidatus Dormibacteraeota bacterium]|nr:hypothetical protein [Candidatus Dormibacteraeota bacterium]